MEMKQREREGGNGVVIRYVPEVFISTCIDSLTGITIMIRFLCCLLTI